MGETPSAPPAPAELPAPADLIPVQRFSVRFAWYVGTVLLAGVLAVFGHSVVRLTGFAFLPNEPYLRFDSAGLGFEAADLHAPFTTDADAMLILPLVKAFVETGTHWKNDRIGCPGDARLTDVGYPVGQELYDFPVIDHLHFAVLWLLARFIPDVVVVFNVYFLLTYPLTALTGMLVFRWLRLTLPAAAVGGLLYAFLPYHYLRFEHHYFLAAYWLVPVSMVPMFQLLRGEHPLVGRLRRWSMLGQLALAAATASGGAYYAFFACGLYAIAAAHAVWFRRDWRAAASAGMLVGAVLAFGVLNHLPMFLYQAKHGKNEIAARMPEEAEEFGMKLPQLVLPIDDHSLTVLSRVKARYNTAFRTSQNENRFSSLGLIGAVGFTALLVMFVFPAPRRWPFGPLSFVAGLIVLFSLIGGLGSLFNFAFFAQVRCYNRFSVCLAFLCLFAVLWPLDRFLAMRAGRWTRRLRYPAFALVALLGFLDQTPFSWFSERSAQVMCDHANKFAADRRFFTAIEERMADVPGGARIFTLPYIPFPEYSTLHRMQVYEPSRGYLHTNTVLWSHGAVKNREADSWARDLACQPTFNPFDVMNRLVHRGYDGLVIDTRGFGVVLDSFTNKPVNEGLLWRRDLKAVPPPDVPLPETIHEDGEQFFLDLRPYRDWRRRTDPDFESKCRQEREWPMILWLDGFVNYEAMSPNRTPIWAAKSAKAMFFNPSDRERTFDVVISFAVEADGPFAIRLRGRDGLMMQRDGAWVPWTDEFTIERPRSQPPSGTRNPAMFSVKRTYRLHAPAGRSAFLLNCDPPRQYVPPEYRMTCYYILDYKIAEVTG